MRPHLPRLVLAVAAVASVATSQVSELVEDSAVVPQAILDPASAAQRYAIQLDRSGRSTSSLGGELRAELDLRGGPGAEPAQLVIVLLSSLERQETVVTVDPDRLATASLTLPAWLECYASSPCSEDYTLTVERASGDLEIEVSGLVVLETTHYREAPEIALGVTPL